MAYTLIRDRQRQELSLGGRRTLAEILDETEYVRVRDGILTAVSQNGGVMDLSSPLEDGEVVTLRYSIDANEIQVLPAVQALRLRPEMYVGPKGSPCIYPSFIREALCFAVESAMKEPLENTDAFVHTGSMGTVRVGWEGLPPPLEIHPSGKRIVELLCTELFACRDLKISEDAKDFCRYGLVTVNALSSKFVIEAYSGGEHWIQRYEKGEAQTPLQIVPSSDRGPLRGGAISFIPDFELLGKSEVDKLFISALCLEIERLRPNLFVDFASLPDVLIPPI